MDRSETTEPLPLPKVDQNYFTERQGVIAVERLVNQMRCVWRETPNKDVGIDGQIEYVSSAGDATGHLVAVQVKAGQSYLPVGGQPIQFNPDKKHRHYWENFPLPVIIIIYDPENDVAYWQDARRVLRSDQRDGPINIPKDQVLDDSQRDRLFESCGAFGLPIMTEREVLAKLVTTVTGNASFPLTFFDIFSNGLTDIGRKLFFSMGLCVDIAEFKLWQTNSQIGWSIGGSEYSFIHDYVTFLVSQSLIVFDYSDYLIDFYDRQMVSTFIAPLTSRGRGVRDLARTLAGKGNPYELTECTIAMLSGSSAISRLNANQAVAARLQDVLKTPTSPGK